jgi:lysophospholipase L1-like esterase
MRLILALILVLFATDSLPAAARKVMVIGDSQSEEYAFEAGPDPGFSGPDSSPANANILNWVEILNAHRPAYISFGSYKSDYFGYSDLRNGGFAYNWGVPAFTTADFVEVVESSLLSNFYYYTSKNQMRDQLQDEVAYVVIFLGANDVRSRYGDFYNNTLPSGYTAGIVDNLETLVDFVKGEKSSLRIVLVNIPDPGVTPSKIADHPDAAKRAAASARIATLNQDIANLAAAEGCALADVFALTERIRAATPFYVNGTEFLKAGHPENLPHYLFAKDDFHPATMAQGHFANAILAAINTTWSQAIPLLANRSLLADVLALDPDQPLRDWLLSRGLAAGGFADDPDGDGQVHGLEFALGTHPNRYDASPSSAFLAQRGGILSLVLRQPAASTRNGYLILAAEESADLPQAWVPVPAARTASLPDGGFEAWRPLAGTRGFLRMSVRAAP